MGKTISLKLNNQELKNVDRILKEQKITPSKLLRNALWQYINEVNLNLQEEKHDKIQKVDRKVNLNSQEKEMKKVNQVNHGLQIVNNYELLRHYKEEIDWLRNRIEYFERICTDLQVKALSKNDTNSKKKSLISGIRM
jgi:hypothetical protein